MAKASMTGFQRIVHRVRPVPVGSRLRVTRHRHFIAGLFGREVSAGPYRSSIVGVEALDGVRAADGPPKFDVVVEERHELVPGIAESAENRVTASDQDLLRLALGVYRTIELPQNACREPRAVQSATGSRITSVTGASLLDQSYTRCVYRPAHGNARAVAGQLSSAIARATLPTVRLIIEWSLVACQTQAR
jgi:hypothetical protein